VPEKLREKRSMGEGMPLKMIVEDVIKESATTYKMNKKTAYNNQSKIEPRKYEIPQKQVKNMQGQSQAENLGKSCKGGGEGDWSGRAVNHISGSRGKFVDSKSGRKAISIHSHRNSM
jgi:hypothetical protein